MSWILAFLGFAVLILLHELGHFAAAKAVGMRVERFSLFFGKPIWKMRRGETEYQLASIPLGGYVKITGMNPEEELEPEVRARSYAGSPVWKRLFVIAAGPVVNVVIAFVLLAGFYLVEGRPVPTIAVGEQIDRDGAAAGVLRTGDRIVSISLPAGGGTSGAAASVSRTAPGDREGLTGDELEKRVTGLSAFISTGGCNARPLGTRDADGREQVAECAAPQPYTLQIVRDGRPQTLQLTPTYDEQRKRYRLGIAFGTTRFVDANVVSASNESLATMWRVTRLTVEAMVRVVYDPEARKEVSSVVGGYEATRQSFEVDTAQAISVLALISLSLAIINLFPFLPLDGGHIFWALIEKLRGGRPVATHVLEKASVVGLVLVLMLFAIGLSNDIGRITSGTGFGVR